MAHNHRRGYGLSRYLRDITEGTKDFVDNTIGDFDGWDRDGDDTRSTANTASRQEGRNTSRTAPQLPAQGRTPEREQLESQLTDLTAELSRLVGALEQQKSGSAPGDAGDK
ncbi:hypothetical protein [Streptomyces iconiensis]|uniref:Uncharacterized protein n=1 Tax=Streptomyces iconiensis TaxID=1384038 RepID=A0ABT6ZPN9_9ACTN|nr:hypothetical protein [Streptomyces iconiensis]MDJ1130483.1 hypothetical protein [Streptomyces iconiensis]